MDEVGQGRQQGVGGSLVGSFYLDRQLSFGQAWDLIDWLKAFQDEPWSTMIRGELLPRPRPLHDQKERIARMLAEGQALDFLHVRPSGPEVILRSQWNEEIEIIRVVVQTIESVGDSLRTADLMKVAYRVLGPAYAVANQLESVDSSLVDQYPGWLTIFGPERVSQIGAVRLLMAPAFLIETLPDGGILVVSDPLPKSPSAADRRSSALEGHLNGERPWADAPSFIGKG